VIAVLAAARAARKRRAEPAADAAASALAAGLFAVLVLESAGTSLRGPILPVWYWTWIGLILASVAPRAESPPRSATKRPPNASAALGRIAAGVCGAVLILIVALDARHMAWHAAGRRLARQGGDPRRVVAALERGDGRLGFGAWLSARTDLAYAMLQGERMYQAAEASSPMGADMLSRWREIASRFPAMLDHELRYAEALLTVGQREDARSVLERRLTVFDPFDPAANVHMAREFDAQALQRIDRVQHALRAAALTDDMKALLDTAFAEPGVVNAWRAALRDKSAPPAAEFISNADSPAPEASRIEAYRLHQSGDAAGAIDAQRRAAESYLRLDADNAPYRRSHDAEWDTWYVLARMTYQFDSTRYREACTAIDHAERFALLGTPHERLRTDAVEPELLGDELVPAQLLSHLRPLWRLSAKLRLACGNERYLLLRATMALPESSRSTDAAEREIAALAAELIADFAAVEPARRPPHYEQLQALAGRFGGAAE
ncbi:MAG: hypothetical protein V3T70_06270, partial [Phycisphaerae bacterium]